MDPTSQLSVAFLTLTVDSKSRWYDGAVASAASVLCDLGISVRVFVWDATPRTSLDVRVRLIHLGKQRLAAGDVTPKIGGRGRGRIRRIIEKDYKRRPFDILDVDGRIQLPKKLAKLGPPLIVTLPDLAGRASTFTPKQSDRRFARKSDGLISLSRDSARAAQVVYALQIGIKHRVFTPISDNVDEKARHEAARFRLNFYRQALSLEGVHARTGMAAAHDHEWVESSVVGKPDNRIEPAH